MRENCLVSTSVAVGQSAGKEGGRSVTDSHKKLPSQKEIQGKREGGKSGAILKKREDTDERRKDVEEGCCPEVLI